MRSVEPTTGPFGGEAAMAGLIVAGIIWFAAGELLISDSGIAEITSVGCHWWLVYWLPLWVSKPNILCKFYIMNNNINSSLGSKSLYISTETVVFMVMKLENGFDLDQKKLLQMVKKLQLSW